MRIDHIRSDDTRLDQSNLLGDAGAEAFAPCLRKNTTLLKVGLANNGITDKGATMIASAIQGRTLALLNLRGNKIGEQACARLRACHVRVKSVDQKSWNDGLLIPIENQGAG